MHPSISDAGSYDVQVRLVLAFADGVSRTLRIARALVEADREIELEGLRDTVGLLCARALDLPPALGASIRPRLIGLREDADALSAALCFTMDEGKRP